jgi:hypothetical protein
MNLLLRDSRGNPSWSHTLAVPATIGLTGWFLAGGLDVTIGSLHVLTATKSAAEYGIAVGIWLAYLGQREYTEKCKVNGNGKAPNGA